MGIVEAMAVLSIFFGTFVGGISGAASSASWSRIFGIASDVVSLQGIGQVATTGGVFGFIELLSNVGDEGDQAAAV